jgi:hypothetical protein
MTPQDRERVETEQGTGHDNHIDPDMVDVPMLEHLKDRVAEPARVMSRLEG